MEHTALIALAYLNDDLKELLMGLTLNAFLPDGPTGLTFEVFLAGLCEAHPQQMTRHFRNPDRIGELIRRYKPRPLKHIRPEELDDLIHQRVAAAGVKLPSELPGTVPAASVRMEPRLTAIFEKAVRIAQEGHLPRAGIPEFVKAFSSDEQLLSKLSSETGLMLRTNEHA